MEEKQILELIREAIQKADPTAEAWLFGSRARGDYREDSDWDILILINNERVGRDEEGKFIDNLIDVEMETDQSIIPLVYTKTHWSGPMSFSPLHKNVLKEGVRLC